jgi:ABC-type Fe3+ transport system permease subunit
MTSIHTLVSVLVLSCALALIGLQRRYERRRRLQVLGRSYFDDRDSLEKFRRIVSR